MSPGVQMLLGALADFVGALGLAVSAAMMQAGVVHIPTKGIWILGILAGAMAAASHVKASLAAPPPRTPPAPGPGGGGG